MSKYHQTETQLRQEEQIIFEAKSEPAKFRPLYDKYYEEIFRFIFRRTADEDLTADLTSQVFLKAMQKLPDYEFRGVPFSAWLYRIATNELNISFRAKKKERTVTIEGMNLQSVFEEMDDDDYEEKKNDMLKAFQKLKPAELGLLEMRFFEKKAFKEIGEIMDITENNAKVRMYRILDRLKKIMTNK